MIYTVQSIKEQLSVLSEDIENYIRSHDINVKKDGGLSEQSYQMILDFFVHDNIINGNKKNGVALKQPENGNSVNASQKPYYETDDQRISLYQEDAISFLKKLPPNSIDIIITDPAYSGMNQRLKLGSGKIIGKYADAGKEEAKWFEEFHDTEENYASFLRECYRVLKKDRHIYIMFDSYSLLSLAPIARKVFEVKNVICWDKANIGLGHYFRRRHEFILFASKGKRPLNSKNIPDVWKIKRVVASKYPTQKPTEVFELMLKGSAEKDFIVCDPFLGGGSAAIAAIRENCKFVGCDISDKALSFSKERIEKFLSEKKDIYQKTSLLADDDAMAKLFLNGKSK